MRAALISLAFLILGNAALPAEPAEPDPERRKKIIALIEALGSDNFDEREGAEKALLAANPDVLSLLENAMARTDDLEVKLRAERIVAALRVKALLSSTNPDVLNVYAAGELRAGRKANAALLYAKAVDLLYRAAAEETDPRRKQALVHEANLCENQRRLAAGERPELDQEFKRILLRRRLPGE